MESPRDLCRLILDISSKHLSQETHSTITRREFPSLLALVSKGGILVYMPNPHWPFPTKEFPQDLVYLMKWAAKQEIDWFAFHDNGYVITELPLYE